MSKDGEEVPPNDDAMGEENKAEEGDGLMGDAPKSA